MTSCEIARLIKKDRHLVSAAILEAAKERKSIKNKTFNNSLIPNSEFSEDEVRFIYQKLGATRMQKLLLEEQFQQLKEQDYYEIKGTKDFIRKWNMNHRFMCCNTCKFLTSFSEDFTTKIPFCALFNNTLKSFKADVYKDYCTSYVFNELNNPISWYTKKAPQKNISEEQRKNNMPNERKNSVLVGFF